MELFVLIFTVVFIFSVAYSTLRFGIGPTPSGTKAVKEIVALSQIRPQGTLIELGSGWGTLTYALSSNNPCRKIEAYEISFFPWICSILLLWRRKNVALYRKNFYQTSLSDASVIICYLYPGAMNKLKEKFEEELSEGTLIISNTFSIAGWKPMKIKKLEDFYRTPIFCYRFSRNGEVDCAQNE